MTRPSLRPVCLYLRGAGTLAYFYAGVWRAILNFSSTPKDKKKDRLPLTDEHFHLRGSSSGSLMATMMACNFPLEVVIAWFDFILARFKRFVRAHILACLVSLLRGSTAFAQLQNMKRWWQCLQWLSCLEAKCRYTLVLHFMRKVLTDEMVQRHCDGRLTIVAFSLSDMAVVTRSEWKTVRQIIEWLSASMAIPGVTSSPRLVEGKWLIDAFSLDHWWPRTLETDAGRRSRRVEVHASPFAQQPGQQPQRHHHRILSVTPEHVFTSSHALSTLSAQQRGYLYTSGCRVMRQCLLKLHQITEDERFEAFSATRA